MSASPLTEGVMPSNPGIKIAVKIYKFFDEYLQVSIFKGLAKQMFFEKVKDSIGQLDISEEIKKGFYTGFCEGFDFDALVNYTKVYYK